jgi:hypothetical protein
MPIILDGTNGLDSPDLNITGTGARITGDFSNGTHANRVAFQTTTVNGATTPFIIPNGTGTLASIVVANASDPTNSSYGQLAVVGTSDVRVLSGLLGTGSNLPLTFYTTGSESLRISSTSKAVILAGGNTSANGTGITFPASQSASSDANTLDDYEEGDFTPSWTNLTINSGTPVYTGWYTKIGRLVTVGWRIGGTFNITITANSSRITNLPFTSTQTEWGIWGNVTTTAASYGMQTSGTNLWMAATVSNTGNTHGGTVTYIVST